MISMEGDALRWFTKTWAAWILSKYRPTNSGSLAATKLQQWRSTSAAYRVGISSRDVELASPLEDVLDSIMMGQFINGLKEDIKSEIRLLNPYTLEEMMDLAVQVEERNRVNRLQRNGNESAKTGQFWAVFVFQ